MAQKRRRRVRRKKVGLTISTQELKPCITNPREVPANNCWGLFSPKLGRHVLVTSDLEHEAVIAIELDDQTPWYCEQPLEIEAQVRGRRVRTRFDLATTDTNRNLKLGEVKPQAFLSRHREKSRQLPAQRRFCESADVPHFLFTDEMIRSNGPKYLANAKEALGYVVMYYKLDLAELEASIYSRICQAPGISLRQLVEYETTHEASAVRAACFRLLFAGRVKSSLGTAESLSSVIFRNAE